jgi:hypothetical protein
VLRPKILNGSITASSSNRDACLAIHGCLLTSIRDILKRLKCANSGRSGRCSEQVKLSKATLRSSPWRSVRRHDWASRNKRGPTGVCVWLHDAKGRVQLQRESRRDREPNVADRLLMQLVPDETITAECGSCGFEGRETRSSRLRVGQVGVLELLRREIFHIASAKLPFGA